MPHAPCTMNCIRNPPTASMTAVCEYAHMGISGKASDAASAIVRRRPRCSDSAPKQMPPVSAPRSIAIVMNLGALTGGICFGALSEHLGRRRTIALAASLALPLIPMWAYSHTAVMLAVGGFLMQFMVQGAWGIVPAHLNELSPPSVRAVLPGFAYQLGNLAMAKMAPIQSGLAESHGGNYAAVLAWTMAVVAAALIIVTLLGKERRSAELRVVT